jgi:hypothetical protein
MPDLRNLRTVQKGNKTYVAPGELERERAAYWARIEEAARAKERTERFEKMNRNARLKGVRDVAPVNAKAKAAKGSDAQSVPAAEPTRRRSANARFQQDTRAALGTQRKRGNDSSAQLHSKVARRKLGSSASGGTNALDTSAVISPPASPHDPAKAPSPLSVDRTSAVHANAFAHGATAVTAGADAIQNGHQILLETAGESKAGGV